MIKVVLDFLVGKNPDIFDENNVVRHKLPKKKWEDWQSRYLNDPHFNWRNHKGVQSIDRKL